MHGVRVVRRETAGLPAGTPNLTLVGAPVPIAILRVSFSLWFECGFVAGGAVAVIIGARLERRPESSDLSRIGALEYRDERDRLLARLGFSVVGGVALIVAFVEFVAALVVRTLNPGSAIAQAIFSVAYAQSLLFILIWGRANRSAAYENRPA